MNKRKKKHINRRAMMTFRLRNTTDRYMKIHYEYFCLALLKMYFPLDCNT